MMKGCFVCKEGGRISYVYREEQAAEIKKLIELPDSVITEKNFRQYAAFLREVEVIFCTWDMVEFTKEEIQEYFPNLKVIFYAAASVQYFARPFLELGVRVLTCHHIMAVPVAQFTVASIIFGNKGSLLALRRYASAGYRAGNRLTSEVYPGTYRTKVGILGAGSIGGLVVQMLRDCNVEVMVYDPFLSEERKKALGIWQTYSLEEIFESCQTISCHIANNTQTVGMLNYSLFSRMKDNACFLNTGRGAQVVEADLIRALKEKPMRTAILDVTDPEPVAPDSELLRMENVFLFPHIAGSSKQEVLMFSDFMIEQLKHYQRGEPFDQCEVTLPMLRTMA